jgi:hypothetical protein
VNNNLGLSHQQPQPSKGFEAVIFHLQIKEIFLLEEVQQLSKEKGLLANILAMGSRRSISQLALLGWNCVSNVDISLKTVDK